MISKKTTKNLNRFVSLMVILSIVLVPITFVGSPLISQKSFVPTKAYALLTVEQRRAQGITEEDETAKSQEFFKKGLETGEFGSETGGGSSVGGAVAGCTSKILADSSIGLAISLLGGVDASSGFPVTKGSFAGNLADTVSTPISFGEYLDKNCLDPAARALYKKMLAQTEQSVFNWANNGFKGGLTDGATFPTDLSGYLSGIGDNALSTWISDQDKNNIFYDDIVRQTYQSARENPQASYTPDLAEYITQAECREYQKNQSAKQTESSKNGIKEAGSLNFVRGLFNSNSYPSNNPGFGNGNFGNGSGRGVLDRLGIPGFFNFNDLLLQKVYAQTPTGRLNNLEGLNAPEFRQEVLREQGLFSGTQTNPNQAENENPCTRKLETKAQKQAVLDRYNSGQVQVSNSDWWAVYDRGFKCKNRKECVLLTAAQNKESVVAAAKETEKDTLKTNNGNTGIRQCISYLPQTKEERSLGRDRECRSNGYRVTTPGSLVASQVVKALEVPLDNANDLSINGSFKDFLKVALRGLIGGVTNQLISNVDGIFSFNTTKSKKTTASNKNFTSSVSGLNSSSDFIASDAEAAIARSNAYVESLKENKSAISNLIETVNSTQEACANRPITTVTDGPLKGFLGGNVTGPCDISQYTLDYKNDPTAGAKLAQNPLYIEVQRLDSTRGDLEQISTSLSNASSTLDSLKRARSTYQNSRDVNKEFTYSATFGALAISIPDDISIDSTRSRTTAINKRISDLEVLRATIQVPASL